MRSAEVQARTIRRALFGAILLGSLAAVSGQAPPRPAPAARPAAAPPGGVRLDDLTWPLAEQRLKADAVVVLPLGAGAQEHGLHLKLRTDLALSEYLTRRLLDVAEVVAAPPLAYHHSPAFSEYPGSTSLSLNTARDLTADVVRSVGRHGPRRFYVLTTGHADEALAAAAKMLAGEGILLHYTDWRGLMDGTRGMQQQTGGTHADEIETSMMLYIDPTAVNMASAQRDYNPGVTTPFQLTRRQGSRGTYSPTGAWGDPTLATREKGRIVVETVVDTIRADIERLRRAPLPASSGTPAASTVPPGPRAAGSPQPGGRTSGECLPGDERVIRELGPQFYLAWQDQDPVRVAGLWADGGDMAHPDGLVEGTAQTIRENRAHLFMQREFRGSKHFLTIGTIRCITPDVAIADCKWELRGVTDVKGQLTPPAEGLCTLVLKRRPGGWNIEAWRYNMKPSSPATQPTILRRPGFAPAR